ncbi:MAG TPA: lipocalin family protein [Chitinophaga sp.]|uniref:lipocalin family protein n=1 Tax=Chitinophaga sp. TaxID=1869181 RepID=UPI002F940379
MIKQRLSLLVLLAGVMACRQQAPASKAELEEDSSLLEVTDSVPAADTALVTADTISYSPDQLIGKWLQPVPGLDKQKQGFDLRKDSVARSLNMYTLVYEKWALVKDTLLLWNHTEGVEKQDSAATIDTVLIKELTDSTLVLFPVKAAEGYLEKYEKEAVTKVKSKKVKGKK